MLRIVQIQVCINIHIKINPFIITHRKPCLQMVTCKCKATGVYKAEIFCEWLLKCICIIHMQIYVYMGVSRQMHICRVMNGQIHICRIIAYVCHHYLQIICFAARNPANTSLVATFTQETVKRCSILAPWSRGFTWLCPSLLMNHLDKHTQRWSTQAALQGTVLHRT